ncbi:MAG: tungsten ABC transporter substrate-binding protein [Chloroflexi bacterium]|nr:tungsten ABC transporter substrate-binding protein [Chloroflexota bacterium]MYF81344.1 tungsten ABC transporter substrate-binding protein [Chloroflexota bacterium]MYI04307.1 tungsten ABC transporter substrate-binding protein [Chloroflexota bacterium]
MMSRAPLLGWFALTLLAAAVVATACGSDPGFSEDELILATTTSLNDSGLLDQLVPIFEDEAEVSVKIIAVGTGAALRMGADGNADVLLTHAPDAERVLVEAGDVTGRALVAYNDFVIVGPPDDPASVGGTSDVSTALARIAASGATFASRGDDSGTHKKELSLWSETGVSPLVEADDWYIEVGQGMSATLTVANQRAAYALTDRGTYLSLSADIPDLLTLVEGDPLLLNFYSVMLVNGDKGRINTVASQQFADFLIRDDIQAMIGEYLREVYGQPLFIPAAHETEQAIAARGGTD